MTIFSGTSEEEAIQRAQRELHVPRERLEIRVVQTARRGFLGIGKRLAQVDANVKPAPAKAVKPKQPTSSSKASRPVKPDLRHPQKSQHSHQAEPKQPSLSPEEEEQRQLAANHQRNIATMKKASQALLSYLRAVYHQLGIDVNPRVVETKAHYCQIDLVTDQVGQVIGYHGRRINAVEELGAAFLNYHGVSDVELMLDTGNYRAKRQDQLKKLMDQSITQVIATNQAVFLDPMPARERKYLHKLAGNSEQVRTYSHGREPFRSIVIAPRN